MRRPGAANADWTRTTVAIYSYGYSVVKFGSRRHGDRNSGTHYLRSGARWLCYFAGVCGRQGRAGDDPAFGQPGRRAGHDPARADQQGPAAPVRGPEPGLRLSARFLGDRAIHRSETWHDDIENERRFQRLLLDPARTAERTRRSVSGSRPARNDTIELGARSPRQLRMGDRRADILRNQANVVKLRR